MHTRKIHFNKAIIKLCIEKLKSIVRTFLYLHTCVFACWCGCSLPFVLQITKLGMIRQKRDGQPKWLHERYVARAPEIRIKGMYEMTSKACTCEYIWSLWSISLACVRCPASIMHTGMARISKLPMSQLLRTCSSKLPPFHTHLKKQRPLTFTLSFP